MPQLADAWLYAMLPRGSVHRDIHLFIPVELMRPDLVTEAPGRVLCRLNSLSIL